MFLLQRTWTEMELLPLVCFCLLTCSGTTFGDEEPPVTKIIVKEDEDVILPCSLDSTNIQSDTFDWKKDDQKEVFMYSSGSHYNNGRSGQEPQFKGRVFHFQDQLQSGNASIVIRNTKVTDNGRYTCIFPLPQKRTRSIIELIVDCILKDRTEEKKPGSCPKPSVTNIHQTKVQALLECEVQGAYPQPKIQWLDSENKTVPAEEPQVRESDGKYNIILKSTVKNSGDYRCVSTQEEICHQIYKKIHVFWDEKKEPEIIIQGSNTGWIVAIVVSVFFLVAVGFALYFKRKSNKAELKATISELDVLKKNHQDKDQSSGSAPSTNS